jgi:hypothetical protein
MLRFNGYPITLRSELAPEECQRRLANQFSASGSHAASDKRLFGRQEGHGFIIYPWPHQNAALSQRVMFSRGLDTSRRCRISFQPCPGGTLITGRYAYAAGETLLPLLVIGLIFGIIVGALLIVVGLIQAFQTPPALWLTALGALLLGGSVLIIVDPSDGRFSRERDHIARYLASVLEAGSMPPAAGSSRPRPPG